ncbi:LacI family DNA-binding transcriptional regulator [Arthrobacter sp. A2-55]|uniref:LacI family DNA-binding transcriptional regulator n=1 Tax=Arthrobacter sp. A2-55 TaxID=2897337 RepID=UPI0021CDE195|nr:LacI family DNA-binding transcriptional regulator [Arthrobacter sp. A2-55]MCU6480935.1 LacI family DNA-binding transcriptional regulator [Arthrobacter sp. A2-55]
MAHQFTVREIARQAGVSDATVDRVIHGRPGVRRSTEDQVRQAVRELEGQRAQLALSGRHFMIDVVVDAPVRFHEAVRQALEAELPFLRPAVFRARFQLHERWNAADCVRELERIARRGSHGVILKAPDLPEIAAAVDAVAARGIPVVTLVTDLPASARLAYVGMDNRSAGSTAAYLMSQWMRGRPGTVAVAVSSDFFRGEEEREMGFRATMRALDPGRAVAYLPGSDGLDATAEAIFARALAGDPLLSAVYSVGGGNAGIAAAFDGAGRELQAFIGHDINADNAALLRAGRLHAVLHHELRADVQRCARIFMQAHGALPGQGGVTPSPFSVATPFNIPSG